MSTSSSPDLEPNQFGLPYQPPPLQAGGRPAADPGPPVDASGFLAPDQVPGTVASGFSAAPHRNRSWILPAILIVLLLIGAGAYFSLNSFNTVEVTVGDCMGAFDRTTLKKVDCKAPGAVWKVIAVIENQQRPTPASNPCSVYEGVASSYWQGQNGTGRLFCLTPH